MSRPSTLILLGFLTILTPFSGFPMTIRSLLSVIFGATVLGIGFSMRAREAHEAHPPVETPSMSPVSGVSPI